MSSNNMPKDVEARIRALPGNNICCDCSNVNPQWASVSYGSLMCLECSGQHRALGVHLSFVRSVAMDSWTEKQIAAMERSGGNTKLVEYLQSRGIEKGMLIAKKYNSPQAGYYRERLSRWLDGKTEPPPDPGRYNPETGGGDAQGAEPLPGESTEQYNARQARLREAARERLRQKFGENGLGGVGAPSDMGGGGGFEGGLGGAVSGVGNFLRNNVIENETLRGAVGGVVNSVSTTISDGEVIESLKRNATVQEGSVVQRGLGWVGGAVGGILGGGNQANTSMSQGPPPGEDDDEFFASLGMGRNNPGYGGGGAPASGGYGGNGQTNGSAARGGGYNAGTPQAAPGSNQKKDFRNDDDWGDWDESANKAPPPVPSQADMGKMAKDLGMKLDLSSNGPAGSTPSAASKPAPAPAPATTPVSRDRTASAVSFGSSKSTPKKAPVKLESTEDFFNSFGV